MSPARTNHLLLFLLQVQGHESQQFLALFPNGLRYEDGGIESGFNHVDPDAYEPRLFQVKGKRNPRMVQVKQKYSKIPNTLLCTCMCFVYWFLW